MSGGATGGPTLASNTYSRTLTTMDSLRDTLRDEHTCLLQVPPPHAPPLPLLTFAHSPICAPPSSPSQISPFIHVRSFLLSGKTPLLCPATIVRGL